MSLARGVWVESGEVVRFEVSLRRFCVKSLRAILVELGTQRNAAERGGCHVVSYDLPCRAGMQPLCSSVIITPTTMTSHIGRYAISAVLPNRKGWLKLGE